MDGMPRQARSYGDRVTVTVHGIRLSHASRRVKCTITVMAVITRQACPERKVRSCFQQRSVCLRVLNVAARLREGHFRRRLPLTAASLTNGSGSESRQASMTTQARRARQRHRSDWSYGAASAFRVGVVLALIGATGLLATEASGEPSKFRNDPIPYCLSYISVDQSCDRESKDSAWICREARRDPMQESCLKWDEASILKFCRGWTDGNSIFGEEPAPRFCNGPCWISRGLPPGFRCINPK